MRVQKSGFRVERLESENHAFPGRMLRVYHIYIYIYIYIHIYMYIYVINTEHPSWESVVLGFQSLNLEP